MTVFELLRKLVADLRAGNVTDALGDLLQLFVIVFGYNPLPQIPARQDHPTVGVMHTLASDECNRLADRVEKFCNENDKPGALKFGDGVFLGKLLDLLLKLLPVLIGLEKPPPA